MKMKQYLALCLALALSAPPITAAADLNTGILKNPASSGINSDRAEILSADPVHQARKIANPFYEEESEAEERALEESEEESEKKAQKEAEKQAKKEAEEAARQEAEAKEKEELLETLPDESPMIGKDISAKPEEVSSESSQEKSSESQTESEPGGSGESGSESETESSSESQTSLSLSALAEGTYKADPDDPAIDLYDYRVLREYPLPSLPKDLHTLYYKLSGMVDEYDGTWSVYVEDLSTGQALIVGDQPMKSASTMKLFIMAAVYDQIDQGNMERTDEVVSLLHDMISNSSNEAANRLLLKLGHDSYADGVETVDSYISSHGYSSGTHEYNGFEDSASIVDGSHFNQISAKDIGLLLQRIYSRNFISRNVCNEIENMMLNQATRYKIPKGIPDGIEIANKTGEMDTVENDAAVVYGEKTDFILVVLSEDWGSKDTAQSEIQKIAATTYEYLNSEPKG